MARFENDAQEDEMMSAINTTPLVDVMLVMLIIFLLTVPAILQTANVELPKERNIPTQTTPENIVVSVDKDGKTYWMDRPVSNEFLLKLMRTAAKKEPQPELHIRGDMEAQYAPLGKVMLNAQRVGLAKIAFITEP